MRYVSTTILFFVFCFVFVFPVLFSAFDLSTNNFCHHGGSYPSSKRVQKILEEVICNDKRRTSYTRSIMLLLYYVARNIALFYCCNVVRNIEAATRLHECAV